MKLWYQSMSRQAAWGGYPRVLRNILDAVKDSGTDIHVAGITEIGGVGDQFRYLEYLETGEVLKNVHRAVREGFDAFLIGNIADPGLREAPRNRQYSRAGPVRVRDACRVHDGGQLLLRDHQREIHAANRGERPSLRAAGAVRRRQPHEHRPRLTDLGAGFEPGEARDRIVAQFNAAARRNTDAGAEVVIAAGSVVMALLAHAGIHETQSGVPILNGITNLVKLGEAAVKLNHIMGGRFTSKVCAYAPPPPDQIETFRKHYGADIYPTVKAPE
jgi:allantoin racemase